MNDNCFPRRRNDGHDRLDDDDDDDCNDGDLSNTSSYDSEVIKTTAVSQDEPLMMEPTTLEIEMEGNQRNFVHKITASYPFQVIIAGQQKCIGRKAKIALSSLLLMLFILVIVLPVTKRDEKPSSSEKAPNLDISADNITNDENNHHQDGPILLDEDDNVSASGGGGSVSNRTSTDFRPFSLADPADFFPVTERPESSRPSTRIASLKDVEGALPTNAWYQNLLLLRDGESPTVNHRAYTQPYVVDVGGTIPGLRMQLGRVLTSADQVIVSNDSLESSLTLGVAPPSVNTTGLANGIDKGYTVVAANDLGLTLEWTYFAMRSSIVRGMPYMTMTYPSQSGPESIVVPTIAFESQLSGPLVIDGGRDSMNCGSSISVDGEIEVTLVSGLTYLIFLSSPQMLLCRQTNSGGTVLQVLQGAETKPFTVRAAPLVPSPDEATYGKMLRAYANTFPGSKTVVDYEFEDDEAALVFDWDPQQLRDDGQGNEDIIMFAMPHHQDRLNSVTDHCVEVLLGTVCLVVGNQWKLVETLPQVSFRAPRAPDSTMLPALIDAVSDDLNFRIADNFVRGAGDTYFSGKAIGKLARILVIAEEVLEICEQPRVRRGLRTKEGCDQRWLPDRAKMDEALKHLKLATEVWLSGDAQAPLLYDAAWGGVVSCGCNYADGNCKNTYPDCPGLTDQGLNFGAGFYNDHHFHYGYHIYAAAIIAHFDPVWGRANFERVMLLVRDIANPSKDDPFFPTTRHKDWFHGSSWASGISLPVSPTGMNQESSSEAIAGYEAVALFGKTMSAILTDETSKETSSQVYKFGRLLVATELRSTQRYWQVSEEDSILSEPYEHNVVGILWSSKLCFGTWFGNNPYLIYGIQLLPLTPISEERDDIDWVKQAFDPYALTCDARCVAEGWSVQILALLATLGFKEKALEHAQDLTSSIFETAGGNGHSLSNTIWYISTRPAAKTTIALQPTYPWEAGPFKVTCLQKSTCTDAVLNSMAGEYSCRNRIEFMINSMGETEYDACYQIAVTEFPKVCGACSPGSERPTEDIPEEPFEVVLPDVLTCNNSATCTVDVLSANAGGFSCRDRMKYLIDQGSSEIEACRQVASMEFPSVCGGCDPN